MQFDSKDFIVVPVTVPPVYLKNPRIMKTIEESFGYSGEKHNTNCFQKPSSHLITPTNVQYMCTGDKFAPISTNMSLLELNSVKNKPNNNMNQQHTWKCSTPLASPNLQSPRWLPPPIPLNNRNTQKEKNVVSNSSNANAWKNHYYKKQNIMNSQLQTQISTNDQSMQSRSIFFTGTIERILRWNRNLRDIFCLYETIAPVISLQEGRISHQKIMLLRDRKGPILQVQYFSSTHIDINDFHIGQYLRCVGRMIGMNILSAESIREAKEDEILNLSRLSYVCDYSVNQNMNRD